MNEVMLLFSMAPLRYRKILFVLKHLHHRTNQSLATHYIRTQGHLISEGVEVWEFDLDEKTGARVFPVEPADRDGNMQQLKRGAESG